MATELANSGNFTVVGRQDEDLAELQAEMNMQESIKIPLSRKIILPRHVT